MEIRSYACGETPESPRTAALCALGTRNPALRALLGMRRSGFPEKRDCAWGAGGEKNYCSVPSPAVTASSAQVTAAPIMAARPATIISTLMDAVPSPMETACSVA